jgi:hypothetical protein
MLPFCVVVLLLLVDSDMLRREGGIDMLVLLNRNRNREEGVEPKSRQM